MIGSPASRGAVASVVGAGRACFAAASAVSAASVAIAASVTIAEGPQRRVATLDCFVMNRFANAMSLLNACLRLRRSRLATSLFESPRHDKADITIVLNHVCFWSKADIV